MRVKVAFASVADMFEIYVDAHGVEQLIGGPVAAGVGEISIGGVPAGQQRIGVVAINRNHETGDEARAEIVWEAIDVTDQPVEPEPDPEPTPGPETPVPAEFTLTQIEEGASHYDWPTAPAPDPDPTPDPDPDPDPQPDPVPPPVGEGEHAFYDMLAAHPKVLSAIALRDDDEVRDNVYFSRKERRSTFYDPEFDAARFIHESGSGSIEIGDQVRHVFAPQNSGQLTIYWEAMMDNSWAKPGDVYGLETQKAFQIARGDDLSFEPRHRYAWTQNGEQVAWLDVRTYIGSEEAGPADAIAPQVGDFYTYPMRWTSYLMHMDLDANEASYWAWDTEQEVVQILDRARANFNSHEWSQFWFEFNSSQRRAAPEAYAWGRNNAVLKDLSLTEVQSLIAAR